MGKVNCYRCQGLGYGTALVKRTDGCNIETWNCPECAGSGLVDEDPLRQARRSAGRRFRERRMALDLSLYDLSKLTSLRCAEISSIEMGDVDMPAGWPEVFDELERRFKKLDEQTKDCGPGENITQGRGTP